jgi:GntR family carbon starvation induced transcriptional regulator
MTLAREHAAPTTAGPESDKKSSPPTLTTSVYSQLRADVVSGRLQPGTKLRAQSLRKRFNTGGSPVREALNRLLAEGFVSLVEQKGFRVAPISREELAELLEARILIDGTALTESIRRFERSWEDGLVLALHHLSRAPRSTDAAVESAWDLRHKAFHQSLVGGCGSRWMRRMSEQLFDAAERYRLIALPWIPERNELKEHQALVDACLNRDADRAIELLKSHYGQTAEAIVKSGRI